MIETQKLIQRYIILELTLKALERDQRHVPLFKTQFAFSEWFTHKIDEVYREFLSIQKEMKTSRISFLYSEKVDSTITQYTFNVQGHEMNYRYSNVALRNWTNEEVKRLLLLPYRTSDKM